MKQLLTLDVHSYIDIITNSSSEIFISDNTRSVKTVIDILTLLCNNYNVKYEDVFGEIAVIDDDNILDFIDMYSMQWGVVPCGSNMEIKSSYDCYAEANKICGTVKYPYDDNIEYNKDLIIRRNQVIEELRQTQYNTLINDILFMNALKGNIYITSNSSNSIPYDMIDEIEEIFNGDRYHLG